MILRNTNVIKLITNWKKDVYNSFFTLKNTKPWKNWMIAISIILCEHTVYIYIDTPIKYGYICIYVSSNFILCASLLILKQNKILIIWKEWVLSYQTDRSVKVISDETNTVDKEYCTKMCKISYVIFLQQDMTHNSCTA